LEDRIILLVIVSIAVLGSVGFSQDVMADASERIYAASNDDMERYMYLVDEYALLNYDELPIKYPIGITLTRIGAIDSEVGSYEADFWLWVEIFNEDSPIDFTANPPEFDFTNAGEIDMDSELIEPHYYEVRIRGTFFNEMDFRHYPFEKLNLIIEVEPKAPNDIEQLQLVLDPTSEIDSTAKVLGWNTGSFELNTVDHAYDKDEIFSRFTANFIVERSAYGSVIKNILPVSLITGLSLLIFYIPENFTPRIYLTAPLLLSLVYLHQSSLDEIPPVGYMTIFDKIMLINFALFVNAIVSLAIQMKINVIDGDSVKVKKVNNLMRLFIPVIVVVGVIIILMTL
jgi:hypothetical protein